MLFKLSVLSGFLYSFTYTSTFHTFQHSDSIPPYFLGFFSALLNLSSLFSLLFLYLFPSHPKFFYLISSLFALLSPFPAAFSLQSLLLGLSCPLLISLSLYSTLAYGETISYSLYYNVSCLFGTSFGLLYQPPKAFLALPWSLLLIVSVFAGSKKSSHETSLPQIVSIKVIYFVSFLIELFGETVNLVAPAVLHRVWDWENSSIDYLFALAHLLSVPALLVLTNRYYTTSKQLMVTSLGICGVGASMLTGLLYTILIQQCAGICVAIIGVYFARAAICYFVNRAFGQQEYFWTASAGTMGRASAGIIFAAIDREDFEEVNRSLFFPITVVILMSMLLVKWKDDKDDRIKQS
jgi:hypothetical protein